MKLPGILKPSKKKVIILIILGLVIILLGFIFLRRNGQNNFQFAEVKRGEIKETVSSSGTLSGKEVADLKFKSSGKLGFINVKAGDLIKKGGSVAGLDTTQLQIDLQQARNTLVAKDAAAKRVEDDVKDHDKDETFTQKETRTAAQVARDNAYDEVKATQETLNDAYLYTPIAGLVTKAPLLAGQNVATGDLIAQVVNVSQIYFDTEVDETDIGKIARDQQAEVTLDAYPDQVFQGIVDQIIPRTQETSSGANIVVVRIKLKDIPANFVQGLSGQSEIIVRASSDTLYIPIEALRDDKTVVVKIDQDYREIKVVIGILSDTDIEIKEGLSERETVMFNPPLDIKSLKKKSIFSLSWP